MSDETMNRVRLAEAERADSLADQYEEHSRDLHRQAVAERARAATIRKFVASLSNPRTPRNPRVWLKDAGRWETPAEYEARTLVNPSLAARRAIKNAKFAERYGRSCQCWNEGQYGRVHREDCPLHGPESNPREPHVDQFEKARADACSCGERSITRTQHGYDCPYRTGIPAVCDPPTPHEAVAVAFDGAINAGDRLAAAALSNPHPANEWAKNVKDYLARTETLADAIAEINEAAKRADRVPNSGYRRAVERSQGVDGITRPYDGPHEDSLRYAKVGCASTPSSAASA